MHDDQLDAQSVQRAVQAGTDALIDCYYEPGEARDIAAIAVRAALQALGFALPGDTP